MPLCPTRGRGRVLVSGLVLAAVAAGCAHRKGPASPDGAEARSAAARDGDGAGGGTTDAGVRLVGEDEVASLIAGILKEAEANAHRVCRRPVLRGEALPGPADDDIAAVVEDPGPATDCRASVQRSRDLVVAATRYAAESLPAGWRPRSIPYARPMDEPASGPAATLDEAEHACARATEALGRAVSHEDSCDPYLAGRRARPVLAGLADLTHGIGLVARQWMREGRIEDAARLLLDGLRFFQDLGRGGTWVSAMIGVALARILAPDIELLFDFPGQFPAGLAASLQGELTALLAAEPHPSVHFADECLDSELQDVLPNLMPDGWTPPGGWDDGTKPGPARATSTSGSMDPRDEQALSLLALQEVRDRFLSACPAGCTREACAAGVASATAAAPGSAELRGKALGLIHAALQPGAEAGAQRTRLRKMMVESLVGLAMPMFAGFPARTQERIFLLAGFRLLAAFRQVTDATGRCPQPADFDQEPLLSARRDAPGGGLLQVEVNEPSRTYLVTTAAPLWTSRPHDDPTESHPFLVLRCPAARELPAAPVPATEPVNAGPLPSRPPSGDAEAVQRNEAPARR